MNMVGGLGEQYCIKKVCLLIWTFPMKHGLSKTTKIGGGQAILVELGSIVMGLIMMMPKI
jgi:hypothetical protein